MCILTDCTDEQRQDMLYTIQEAIIKRCIYCIKIVCDCLIFIKLNILPIMTSFQNIPVLFSTTTTMTLDIDNVYILCHGGGRKKYF